MATTGEKPGKGVYICTNCGKIIVLDSDDDKLPPCSNCNHTTFIKK